MFYDVSDLKVAFALFDKDGDGAITVSELLSVMKSLGFKSDDLMVKKMIDRFDYDGECWRQAGLLRARRFFPFRVVGDTSCKTRRTELINTRECSHLRNNTPKRNKNIAIHQSLSAPPFFPHDHQTVWKTATSLGFDLFRKGFGFRLSDNFWELTCVFLLHAGNGTLEFEEFLRMMTTRNEKGVTRWESSREPRAEPEAWRAFKVCVMSLLTTTCEILRKVCLAQWVTNCSLGVGVWQGQERVYFCGRAQGDDAGIGSSHLGWGRRLHDQRGWSRWRRQNQLSGWVRSADRNKKNLLTDVQVTHVPNLTHRNFLDFFRVHKHDGGQVPGNRCPSSAFNVFSVNF